MTIEINLFTALICFNLAMASLNNKKRRIFIMKKKKILMLSLILVIAQIATIFAAIPASATEGPRGYVFYKAEKGSITLDGKADEGFWANVPSSENFYKVNGDATNQGFSASFKAVWAESSVEGKIDVVILASVNDSTSDDVGNGNWQDDYFAVSLTNKKNSTMIQNNIRYMIGDTAYRHPNEKTAEGVTTEFAVLDKRTEGYYTAEYKVTMPVELAGDEILFDVMVNDRTSGSNGYSRHCWINQSDGGYVTPRGIGYFSEIPASASVKHEINLGYNAYKTAEAIELDGKANESAWKDAPWSDYFGDFAFQNGTLTTAPDEDYNARVKSLWKQSGDQKTLYVYLEVNDKSNSGDGIYVLLKDDSECLMSGAMGNNSNVNNQSGTLWVVSGSNQRTITYTVLNDRANSGKVYMEMSMPVVSQNNNIKFDIITYNVVNAVSTFYYPMFNTPAKANDTALADRIGGRIALVNEDVSKLVAIETQAGASIRVDTSDATKSGIRFVTTVDAAKITKLISEGATVKTGTLVLPTKSLTALDILGSNFTKENLDRFGLVEGKDYYNIENVGNKWVKVNGVEQTGTFYGTIYNIKDFSREFSGVGYVTVTLESGESYTLYGGYKADNARSVADVAKKALALPEGTWNDSQKAILENFIGGEQ